MHDKVDILGKNECTEKTAKNGRQNRNTDYRQVAGIWQFSFYSLTSGKIMYHVAPPDMEKVTK